MRRAEEKHSGHRSHCDTIVQMKTNMVINHESPGSLSFLKVTQSA